MPALFVSMPPCGATAPERESEGAIPHYLSTYYWWAYVHPNAVRLFERQWLVNLILWGNYARLRNATLSELGERLPGRTLQVACVYGDLTKRMCDRAVSGGGTIDVVDILPIQLGNLRAKLPSDAPVRLLAMNSTRMTLPDATYDRALVFFLLHEQPRRWGEETMREVCRVVKPGGKIVIVDYARPRVWNPLRYLWRPVLARLEPFALELWRREIADWLPAAWSGQNRQKESFFGGLYQKVVVRLPVSGGTTNHGCDHDRGCHCRCRGRRLASGASLADDGS